MSSTPLLERIGLAGSGQTRHLDFLQIGDKDRAALSELVGFLEEVVDDLVDRFYDFILSFAETAALLEDPELVERLKAAQRSHFLSLVHGTHDAAYFESRLRVGMRHAQIRLAPHWYLGAYAFQMRYLSERLFERFRAEPDRLRGYQDALLKVIMLDIALATNAYIHSGFVERSLADAHEREAARANEALRAKREEERRREELLNMVVHDIRSPVTAMMASARVGLRRYADEAEPPGKQFRLIENAGRNVLGIIDNMLTVARMSQGQIPISPEPFDVAELVLSCVDELRPFAQQTGHGVLVSADEPVPAATLDRMLVRRIISNLLVNACRHTPTGTHVAVSCRVVGDRCEIRVADDGPGIPRAVAAKLFDDPGAAGHRSDGAYVDSGLGLPFCRLASERLGGSIRAEQEGGRGSIFVVELPIA